MADGKLPRRTDPRDLDPPGGAIGLARLIECLTACLAEPGVDSGTAVQLGPEFGARLDPAFASGAAVSHPAGPGRRSYAPRVVIEYRKAPAAEPGWDCLAYGPQDRAAGRLCFFADPGTRNCRTEAECAATGSAVRQLLSRHAADLAAENARLRRVIDLLQAYGRAQVGDQWWPGNATAWLPPPAGAELEELLDAAPAGPGPVAEGDHVQILAPPGHPLHQATGTVTRIVTAEEMWRYRPVAMMADPLAWPAGQVLVTLDKRPPVPHRDDDPGWLWPPVVTLQPGQVAPAPRPPCPDGIRDCPVKHAAPRGEP